jgi:hypothetical protein
MFPRIHYVSRFGPLGSHARDSPFQQSASAASLNWRQESRFRIVISEGGFRSRNPLCLFRKPASEHSRLHPVYVGESFVGSRNCLGDVRDGSHIVSETIPKWIRGVAAAILALACADQYLPCTGLQRRIASGFARYST